MTSRQRGNFILSSFALAMVLLMVLGWLSYRSTMQLVETSQWVTHTHEVLANLQAILADVGAAEGGHRGYLLTGDEKYLEPYRSALEEINEHISKARQLTRDALIQQRRLDQVESLVQQRRRFMTDVLEQFAHDRAAAAESIRSGKGRELSEQIRAVIEQMEDTERQLLVRRQREVAASVKRSMQAITGGGMVSLLLLLGVFWRLKLEIRERRNAEARFRGFLQSAPDAMVIVNQAGTIHLVNAQTEKLFGYTREEMLDKPVEMLIPQLNRKGHAQHRTGYSEVPHARPMGLGLELYGLAKDGREFPAEISLSPIQTSEGVLVSAAIRDVTERHQYQEQIKQKNQELEQRNREVERATHLKSQFLATMSHELRTPLNAILGFSELLLDETAGPLTDKQKRWTDFIQKGGRHLLQLINDILDLSKIEAGQVEVHPENFPAEPTLPEVLSNIKPLAIAKQIELTTTIQPGLAVVADRLRFKQVLYNLLSNAVKFTPAQGRITVEATQHGNFAQFCVTDNGRGISKEDQKVIFEEFRQVEPDESSFKSGTGLGLTITKRLVEQQGGSIWVESNLNEGAHFTFTLPLGETPNFEAPPSRLIESSRRDKPLVLVIEDEVQDRELLTSYLTPERYEVITASSGHEALIEARKFRPDVITLDVLMPTSSGWEILQELQNSDETAMIPVIIVSIVDQRQLGFSLGAMEYLLKPVSRESLVKALRRVMNTTNPASNIEDQR